VDFLVNRHSSVAPVAALIMQEATNIEWMCVVQVYNQTNKHKINELDSLSEARWRAPIVAYFIVF
jgi:hypothetical protein